MFEVSNQPPPLEPYNLFASDTVLREAVTRERAGWAEKELTALGATLGKPETIRLASTPTNSAASAHARPLRPPPRRGRVSSGLARAARHRARRRAASESLGRAEAGAHVARAAGTYMLAQIESGVYCPVAMTYGVGADAAAARRRLPQNGCRGFSAATTTSASVRRGEKIARAASAWA